MQAFSKMELLVIAGCLHTIGAAGKEEKGDSKLETEVYNSLVSAYCKIADGFLESEPVLAKQLIVDLKDLAP